MGSLESAVTIYSLKINRGFSQGGRIPPLSGDEIINPEYSKTSNLARIPYELAALPTDLELDTDARLVFLVGPNGSGKSTLLRKLGNQLFKHEVFDDDTRFFQIAYRNPLLRSKEDEKTMSSERLRAKFVTSDERFHERRLKIAPRPGVQDGFAESYRIMSVKSSGQSRVFDVGEVLLKRDDDTGELVLNDKGWAKNYVLLFDLPERNLDVFKVPYLRELLVQYSQMHHNQMFIATHEMGLLDIPEEYKSKARVIDFSAEPHAQSVPLSDFDTQKYARQPQITVPSIESKLSARITSVTIKRGFHRHTFRLPGDPGKPAYNDWQQYAQGLDGYKVPGLPEGLELETDDQFVILFGRNGSGKSSLLHKLEAQYVLSKKLTAEGNQAAVGEYVQADILGDPSLQLFRYGQRPEEGEREKYSMGQHNFSELTQFLDQTPKPGTILMLDEPEQALDAQNFSKIVEKVHAYATQHNVQVFVATQKPEFLAYGGTVLDFLVETDDLGRAIKPVQSMPAEDFKKVFYSN